MADWMAHARGTDMEPHVQTLRRLCDRRLRVVELGVRSGVSTGAILDGIGPHGHLWSLDVADWPTLPDFIRTDPRWTFKQADDRDDGSWRDIPDGIDVAFIDTSHEYHHTLDEMQRSYAKGATTIILHDWNLPDVADAVRGFCDRFGFRITGIEPSRWGMVWVTR